MYFWTEKLEPNIHLLLSPSWLDLQILSWKQESTWRESSLNRHLQEIKIWFKVSKLGKTLLPYHFLSASHRDGAKQLISRKKRIADWIPSPSSNLPSSKYRDKWKEAWVWKVKMPFSFGSISGIHMLTTSYLSPHFAHKNMEIHLAIWMVPMRDKHWYSLPSAHLIQLMLYITHYTFRLY